MCTLDGDLPIRITDLASGIAVGLTGGPVGWLGRGLAGGVLFGVVLRIVCGLVRPTPREDGPRQISPPRHAVRHWSRSLELGFALMLVVGSALWFLFGPRYGLDLGVMAGSSADSSAGSWPDSPSRSWRRTRSGSAANS